MNLNPLQDLRSLFAAFPGLYLIVKPDLTIWEVSNEYLAATFTSREIIVGRNLVEVFPVDRPVKELYFHYNPVISLIKVAEQGKPDAIPEERYHIAGPGGKFDERNWSILNTPVFDDQQQLIYIIHKIEDIPNTQKGENLDDQNKKKYSYLFEHNPLPMWITDFNTFRYLDVNEAAIQKYGYSRDEFLSMTAVDIRPDEEKEEFIHSIHFNNNGSTNYNKRIWRHIKKDATVIYAEVVVNRIMFNGAPARFVLINDVTEKKIAEENLISSERRFRALIENNNDIIALIDASLHIIYRSPSATRITGHSDEEMKHIDFIKNVHPDDHKKVATVFNEIMLNPGKQVKLFYRSLHKKGHYITLEGTMINLLKEEHMKAIVFNFRDVTERIEAEESLVSSEVRFRSLIENSVEGIALVDEFSNNIYRSPAANKIMGNVTKENTVSLTHPDDLEEIKIKRSEALKNPGVPFSFQGRFLHASGEYIWLEGTLTNLLHVKGINAVVTNFHDITERKNVEQKLIAGEKKFRNALDNMLEGIQIHDFDWKYIYVNDALVKYSKYSREELLGFTVMEKYPGIEQTDLFEKMQHCMEHRVAKHLETEFIFPDGSKADFQLSIQPVPEGIFMLSIDITDRKKAEEDLKRSEMRLKEAQAIAHISNWEIDLVKNVHTWSDEFYRIYGLNKAEVQPSAELFLSLMHPDDAAFAEKKVAEAFETFTDSSFSFRFIRADDIIRFGYTEWRFEFDLNKTPLRLYGILQDITERKEAEQNLQLLEKKILEQKIQEQKKTARAIIKAQEKERNHIGQELHDNVCQILVAAKLHLAITEKKDSQKIANIQYPTELIDTAIREIRLLSSNEVTPPMYIDLKEMVDELLDTIKENTKIKTTFKYKLPKDFCDDDLKLNLYRIIQELLSNTVKHAYAQKLMISLKTNTNFIFLTAVDDGKGFNVSEKRKGIGISNIINRIEAFNGEMMIKSSEGKGCLMQIKIPYFSITKPILEYEVVY